MLHENGDFRVSDFKYAIYESQSDIERPIQGNEKYFSPEKKADVEQRHSTTNCDAKKCDVYALGLMFLEMMRLEFPAELDSVGVTTKDITKELLAPEVIDYSDLVRCILFKMLQPNPKERFSFRQLNAALSSVDITEVPLSITNAQFSKILRAYKVPYDLRSDEVMTDQGDEIFPTLAANDPPLYPCFIPNSKRVTIYD
jgi:serine/threonine protein kinase